jgi:quinol monooxygenase YgiN
MITRVVRLSFKPEAVAGFLETMAAFSDSIRNSPGCTELTFFRDETDPDVFYTISRWEHASDLDRYRNSPLFGSIWKTVKPGFKVPATAWSMHYI